MKGHLIPSRPLWIWQLYIHLAAFAFTWPQRVERRKRRAQTSRSDLASALEGQKLYIISM